MNDLPSANELLERASVLFQMKRYDRAEILLQQCLSIDPHCARAYCGMVIVYQYTARTNLSLATAKRAVACDPSDDYAHYLLANIYQGLQLLVEAEAEIAIAISLHPRNPDYFAIRAEIYVMQNRWTDRITAIESGLALDPNHIECLKLKLRNSIYTQSFTEALATAERLLALSPNDATIHLLAGDIYKQQQKHPQAIAAYQESLRLDPLQPALQELVSSYIHKTQTTQTTNSNATTDRQERERTNRVYDTQAQRGGETETEAAEQKLRDLKAELAAAQQRLKDLESWPTQALDWVYNLFDRG
jgi:tetratricopeptide (TPR) repeat protein